VAKTVNFTTRTRVFRSYRKIGARNIKIMGKCATLKSRGERP
jgi:hypothetical protein